MNRVQAALAAGRCLVAIGARCLQDERALAAIAARSSLPLRALSATAPGLPRLDEAEAEALLSQQGAVLALVEPDPTRDRPGLAALARTVRGRRPAPRVVVVARAFNPFLLPSELRTLKLEHERTRGRDMLQALPLGTAPATPAPAARTRAERPRAPVTPFLDREAEIEALRSAIEEGGGVVVVGPEGTGRRWLAERALAGLEGLERLRDLDLVAAVGFDTLAALLAEHSGDDAVRAALRGSKRPTPAEQVDRLFAALAAPSTPRGAMVIGGLERHLARDGALVRDDRLAMLLRAALTRPSRLSMVFLSTRAPVFHHHATPSPRVVELGGLPAAAMKAFFEAHGAADLPAHRYGELAERTAGHPIALRFVARTWVASGPEGERELPGNRGWMRLQPGSRLRALREVLRERVRGLDPELRAKLAAATHFPFPVPSTALQAVGIDRATRIRLQAEGLLEVIPDRQPRRFHVHPLVSEQLSWREVHDFRLMEDIGHALADQAASADGVERVALQQAANRLFVAARRDRQRRSPGYPDADPVVAEVGSLLRREKPPLDLAWRRATEGLRDDPFHAELRLAAIDVRNARRDPPEEIERAYEEAIELAPTPEIFHHWAWTLRPRRGRAAVAAAIQVLERGCQAFPDDARLLRRLALLYREAGRNHDAEAALRRSIVLEPDRPEGHALLGQILADRGPAHFDEAEAAMREALRLDPDAALPLQLLGSLLHQRGLHDEERREPLWAEARELLERAIRVGARGHEAHAGLGQLLLDMLAAGYEADADRVAWVLRKAVKIAGGREPMLRLALARALSRSGAHREANAELERIEKTLGRTAPLLAARSEVLAHAGRIFKAEQAISEAIRLAPPDDPHRAIYLLEQKRLQHLIDTGQALEIEREADAREVAEPAPESAAAPEEEGPRREPGATTVRRRGRGSRRRSGRSRRRGQRAAEPTAAPPDPAEAPADPPPAAPPSGEPPPA